jgi:hypothetical protein
MANNFRVAGFVLGLAIKAPVHTVLTSNIPVLTGLGQNINGWIVGNLDRVLVTAQTNPVDNGIYSARTSAWVRDGDADGNRDFVGGTLVPVWIPGNSDVTLYRLGGAPDAKTIGVDALTFTVYYDPTAGGGGDTLQIVTTAGATTDVPIIFNPVGPAISMITLNTGGLLTLANSLDSGTMTIGHSATTAMRFSMGGAVTGVQFEGLTSYMRLLGSGGDGPSLIIAERAAADPSLAGLGQVWVNGTAAPNELMFTNDDAQDQNLSTELWDNGTRQVLSNSLGIAVRLGIQIGDDDNGFGAGDGFLWIASAPNASIDFPNMGQYWVRSSAPVRPTFTNEDGDDQLLDPSISEIISVVASRVGILTDKGKTVGFSGGTAAQTMTIPAEGSVAHAIGTFLAWDNNGSVPFSIAITTDTLIFAQDASTGTRTVAPGGMAVALKIAAATWKIDGAQVT